MSPHDLSARLSKHFPDEAFQGLPSSETEDAYRARRHLNDLSSHITRIAHALALVDFAKARYRDVEEARDTFIEDDRVAKQSPSKGSFNLAPFFDKISEYRGLASQYMAWIHIAARDTAITIHDFHRSMAYARKAWECTETLDARINKRAVDASFKLFTQYFPEAKQIRDAAGHQVDFQGTEKDQQQNSISDEKAQIPGALVFANAEIFLSCFISDNTVYYSGYGETLAFDLTPQTLESLIEIMDTLYKAVGRP